MKKLFLEVMFIIGIFLGFTANGYAFSYTEPADIERQTFALEMGANTVSGTISYGLDDNGEETLMDYDDFSFEIGAGMILSDLILDYSTSYSDNGDGVKALSTRWYLQGSPAFTWRLANITAGPGGSTSGHQDLGPPEILGTGIYYFWNLNHHTKLGDSWIAEYTFTLHVDKAPPVPEPATMLLLGTGLVGIAGFRRKSKK